MSIIPLLACPWCDSTTAELVRTGIFNDEFLYNAVVTLSPLGLLMLIVALVYCGVPWDRPAQKSHATVTRGATHDQRG